MAERTGLTCGCTFIRAGRQWWHVAACPDHELDSGPIIEQPGLTPSADLPACRDDDPAWSASLAACYPDPPPACEDLGCVPGGPHYCTGDTDGI